MGIDKWMNKRTPLEVGLYLLLIVTTVFLLLLLLAYILLFCMGSSINCKHHCEEFRKEDPDIVTNANVRRGQPCTKKKMDETTYNYLAALVEVEHIDKYNQFKYVCATIIISPKWAITATYCVKPSIHYLPYMFVRAGSNYWSRNGIMHSIKECFYDPEDKDQSFIVAMELYQPLFNHPSIQPFDLKDIAFPDGTYTALSWTGSYFTSYKYREKMSPVMQYQVEVFTGNNCTEWTKLEKVSCAGDVPKANFECFYDVGAPLMTSNSEGGADSIVAIVIDSTCINSTNQRVAISLSTFIPWLKTTAGI